MMAMVGLLLLTLASMPTQVQCMPSAQPDWDFLNFSANIYGSPQTPVPNLQDNLRFDNQELFVLRTEGWLDYWRNRKHMQLLSKMTGVWKGKAVGDLTADLGGLMRVMLVRMSKVLQPPLLISVAKVSTNTVNFIGDNAWKIFSRSFSWTKADGGSTNHMCMPYNTELLTKQRAANKDTVESFSIDKKTKYLKVVIGRTANTDRHKKGKPITEYAHRMLCYAFHGKPQGVANNDPNLWHVAHLCNNPTCLNPMHLRWATARWNQQFPIFWPKTNMGLMATPQALAKLEAKLAGGNQQ